MKQVLKKYKSFSALKKSATQTPAKGQSSSEIMRDMTLFFKKLRSARRKTKNS